MIDEFYMKYGVPTYRERTQETFEPRPVCKDQVFAILCMAAQSPGGMNDPGVRSVREMANQLGVSEYQTRKCVRELVADGLAMVAHSGGVGDDGSPYCYHGFAVTKKAKQTQTYQDADKAMMEEFKKMCEMTIKEDTSNG